MQGRLRLFPNEMNALRDKHENDWVDSWTGGEVISNFRQTELDFIWLCTPYSVHKIEVEAKLFMQEDAGCCGRVYETNIKQT